MVFFNILTMNRYMKKVLLFCCFSVLGIFSTQCIEKRVKEDTVGAEVSYLEDNQFGLKREEKKYFLENNFEQQSILECEKCNLDYIVKVDTTISNLDYKDLQNFLCTFDSSCVNNDEFSEYGNEVLFLSLEKYPEEFMRVFDSISSKSKEIILDNLESPIFDNIDVLYIISIIQNDTISGEPDIKEQLLASLKIAQQKSGN